MSDRRIRCVAFDAVGTLIHPEPSVSRAYCEIGRKYGSSLSKEEIAGRFKSTYRRWEQGAAFSPQSATALKSADGPGGDGYGDDGRGDDGREGLDEARRIALDRTSEACEWERWRRIVTEVLDDVTDPAGCFEELFAHFGLPEAWRCFDDVAVTLQELRQSGLQVVIASNYDARLHSVCDGLPELANVACRVISAEVGYRKPSGRFFEALLAATHREPQEVLMVGDDLHNDVTGAVAAGLPAVWLRRNGEISTSQNADYRIIRSLAEVPALL